MRRQSDVIRQQMEGTRAALADKIGQLEDTLGRRISKVVKKTTSAVDNITDTVEETVEEVGDTVTETVKSLQRAFSLRRQASRHPWVVVGAAAFVGYVVGSLIPSRRHRLERPHYGRDYRALEAPRTHETARKPSHGNGKGASATSTTSKAVTAGMGLMATLQPVLERLRTLAMDTTLGLARQMLHDYLPPSVAREVEQSSAFRSFSDKNRGERASEQTGRGNRPEGGTYERYQSEMGRPMGPASRPGEKPLG